MSAENSSRIQELPGLVSFWDFQEPPGTPRLAVGAGAYALAEMAGPVERVGGGLFGPHAAFLRAGQWLSIPRRDCPRLDLHGPRAQVSVVAWIRRHRKAAIECEFVAGIWNESRARRQYGLFLDLRLDGSADQVGGHVSGTGGPSPGSRWCLEASIGAHPVDYFDRWHCVGFTYDGTAARSYLDGEMDAREGRNPYPYPHGLFDAGPEGGDFTVGAVDRLGEVGNHFTGVLAGLAVFDRALSGKEMAVAAEVSRVPVG